jgi:hypothetical protein
MPARYRSTTLTNSNPAATRNIFIAKLSSSSGAVLWANGYGAGYDEFGYG